MSVVRTVARVREHDVHAEVMFFESPRIFRLPKAHPSYTALLRRLQDASLSGAIVRVTYDAADDGAISDVGG